MAPRLVAEEGELSGLVLSLEDGNEWIIGRDPDFCQLVVEDASVSRQHVLCKATPDGILVENLSETNPCLLNDEPLEEPAILHQGDTLHLGHTTLHFYEKKPSGRRGKAKEEAEGEEAPEEEAEEPHRKEKKTHPKPAKKQKTMSAQLEKDDRDGLDSIFEDMESHDEGAVADVHFNVTETGRWLLKVISGPNNGAEFSMQTGSNYLIGTDANACDIVFHDTSVSRQHARISISDNGEISIEDLNSRNGTLIDAEPLKGKIDLPPNTIVTVGTTSFVVIDREGEMKTIIAPLMPSIVKILQKEEARPKAEAHGEKEAHEKPSAPPEPIIKEVFVEKAPEKTYATLGAFILLSFITGIFVLIGVGMSTLFKSQPVAITEVSDPVQEIGAALKHFPGVKFSYNKASDKVMLIGHVLSPTERNEIRYNLQNLNFLKGMDDSGLVIDEYVWKESNQMLNKVPQWRGVNIHANSAGRFVVSGSLQTRNQAERLSDYLAAYFPYPDLLENHVIVDEDISTAVTVQLQNAGFKDIKVQISNGELTLTGTYPSDKAAEFEALVDKAKKIVGVRTIRNLATQIVPAEAVINISDKYEVSGYSNLGGKNISVVINGKILTTGDILDGMTIIDVQPNAILLEKDGVKYRIDYGK